MQAIYDVPYSLHACVHDNISTDGAPYDGAARERLHPNSPVLVSLYSIAAIAGIAFAGFCLVFNTVFRNKR